MATPNIVDPDKPWESFQVDTEMGWGETLLEGAEAFPRSTLGVVGDVYDAVTSPIETGKSFLKNSLIKAKFFSKKSKMICLADDSGLEIDILDGAPGIHSSRWGGKSNNFNKAISRVFRKINEKDKNWKQKKIKARFICALTIYWPNGKSVNSIGKVEGHISAKKKGNNGFGYDPIFTPLKKNLLLVK